MNDFSLAFKESLPVGVGYVPIGMAFGLFAVSQGFTWWWAVVTATIIYAGSMEFIAVGLMLGGAPFITTALTTLFVNFRHIFYGLSFPTRNIKSIPGRLYSVHTLTDEAYALLANPTAQTYSGPRILWIQFLCQLYWVTGVTTGALVGTVIPFDLAWLDFTLVALFTVLAIDVLKTSDHPVALATIAALCAGLALIVAPDYMLITSMTAYAVIVAVARKRLA